MSAITQSLGPSLLVALGGGIGAVGRYQLGRAVTHWAGPNTGFPWSTLSANVIGSLAMGLLVGWLAHRGGAGSETVRLLLGVGLLGGFTTFSAFGLDAAKLFDAGHPGRGAWYVGLSVLGGIAGAWIAMRLAGGRLE